MRLIVTVTMVTLFYRRFISVVNVNIKPRWFSSDLGFDLNSIQKL